MQAICDSCGIAFRTNFIGGFGAFQMKDCRAGPCPSCGGWGTIPDGTYQIAADRIIAFVRSSSYSANERERLAEVLRQAQIAKASAAETADAIERASPRFSSIAREFRKTPMAALGGVAAVLGLVIAGIGLLKGEGSTTVQNNTTIINNYVAAEPMNRRAHDATAKKQRPLRAEKKPGRNDPCPCGSGKKYKNCHGCAPRP
jgi:hypothetical protein